MTKVLFSNVQNSRIRNIFSETCDQFKDLDGMKLILRQRSIKTSTMQAQPVINLKSAFLGIDTYRIQLAQKVRDSETIEVRDLPKDVLKGWFAHEIGHIIDYQRRSVLRMIGFGLNYVFSRSFRQKTEHRADQIAIENGFIESIVKTKKFILENDLIKDTYKQKIRRYYMSEQDARSYAVSNVPIDPVV